MRQLTLDVGVRGSYAPEDLTVSAANAALIAELEAEPSTAIPGLLLTGPPKSGKTHLARLWAVRHRALWLSPESLGTQPADMLLQGRTSVVLDGLEQVRDWPALAQAMNQLKAQSGFWLMTVSGPVDARLVPLPDARSRLQALQVRPIPKPDDDLLEALLRKRFSDWQWQAEEGVIHYMMPRLPRDYTGLDATLERLRWHMAHDPGRLTVHRLRQWMEPHAEVPV